MMISECAITPFEAELLIRYPGIAIRVLVPVEHVRMAGLSGIKSVVYAWLEENVGQRDQDWRFHAGRETLAVFYFRDELHAVHFKLRWG